jgi:hypothetical protein
MSRARSCWIFCSAGYFPPLRILGNPPSLVCPKVRDKKFVSELINLVRMRFLLSIGVRTGATEFDVCSSLLVFRGVDSIEWRGLVWDIEDRATNILYKSGLVWCIKHYCICIDRQKRR